ncbi:MAG TPA: hypothetical protein VK787_15420 [Puia sp.]|jgi:hypothetical protein|nr:hypothetical protein [Puia sp.]
MINCHNLFSQNDSSYFNLVYRLIRHNQTKGTIYYSDKPYNKFNEIAFKSLLTDSVINMMRSKNKARMVLTKKERDYIFCKLRSFADEILPDSLFPNSKRIINDSLLKHTVKLNRVEYDTLMSLEHDSLAFQKYDLHRIKYLSFFFSRPISIRNNSIFLSVFGWFENWYGETRLSFIVKRIMMERMDNCITQ